MSARAFGPGHPAYATETRVASTARYLLPSGESVAIRFDAGELVPWKTTFQRKDGKVVDVRIDLLATPMLTPIAARPVVRQLYSNKAPVVIVRRDPPPGALAVSSAVKAFEAGR